MQPLVAAALISVVLQSPNGRNEIAVSVDPNTGVVTYRVSRDGLPVISATPISFTLDGVRRPGKGTPNVTEAKHDDIIAPIVPTIAAEFFDRFIARDLQFPDGTTLELRAYDD